MLCDSVGITPVANNGTLHLPLQPLGIHGSDDFEETVYDPTPLDGAEAPSKSIGVDPVSVVPISGTTLDGGSPAAAPTGAEDKPEDDNDKPEDDKDKPEDDKDKPEDDEDRPEDDEDNKWIDQAESKIKGVWDWVKEKAGGVWGKVKGKVEGSG